LYFFNITNISLSQIQRGDVLPGLTLNFNYTKINGGNPFGDNVEGGYINSLASVLFALDSNNAIGVLVGVNYNENPPYGSSNELPEIPLQGRFSLGV